ncbi:type II secretion system GspH family protein [Candidatus Parcubacteria bacterium]|nr:type II secretion system GspH family protein [Candidatus Parcubacteria bacterium]
MNRNKGFTLIELLVVIAIIGILSSVVLASLNTARGKGSDAAIKSQLAAIRPQAEIFYDTYGNYGAVAAATSNAQCTAGTASTLVFKDATIANQIAGATANSPSALICSTNANPATAWAIAAQLKTSTTLAWCVDSTGASKQETITASTPSTAITSSACN